MNELDLVIQRHFIIVFLSSTALEILVKTNQITTLSQFKDE